MSALLLIGSVVVSAVAKRCAHCGHNAMIFVSQHGRTRCVACAEVKP